MTSASAPGTSGDASAATGGTSPVAEPTEFGRQVFEAVVGTSWLGVGVIVATACAMYVAALLLVRLMGLRSLSRISSFDFTVTIAIGAVLGSTVSSTAVSLIEGAVALLVLLGLQRAVAFALTHWSWASVVDNQPVLLVDRGEVLEDRLREVNVTREELYATLRTEGVLRLQDVRAVVMERTGVLSVLEEDPERELDPDLLIGVRGRGLAADEERA